MATAEANNTEDMGYDKPYEPVVHRVHGFTITELEFRDPQWDCVDPSGRLTYRPSQRQYTVTRPDGRLVHHGDQPVVLTRYGAALHLVYSLYTERRKQEDLIRELVTGN